MLKRTVRMSLLYVLIAVLVVTYSKSITTDGSSHLTITNKTGDPGMSRSVKETVHAVGAAYSPSSFTLEQLEPLYAFPMTEEAKKKVWQQVRRVDPKDRKKVLVTGGAGFVGSHLVDRLMLMGNEVFVVDNLYTGRTDNLEHWIGHAHFHLMVQDVEQHVDIQVDRIYHLACPASPPHYQANPIKTIETSVFGTRNMLELATRKKARILFTSTSEVYGDPEEHPQREEYWGHVNPIGPRACYDEGKRVAETFMYSYNQVYNVEIRVARIFNTFGERMNPQDGRVVSNFVLQALKKQPLTIYGDGSNTRSFQYVHDLVDGLIALMESNFIMPVNLGNPEEYSIKEFAEYIRGEIDSKVEIKHLPATEDDPKKRKPNIERAKKEIGWEPRFSVKQGLKRYIDFMRKSC